MLKLHKKVCHSIICVTAIQTTQYTLCGLGCRVLFCFFLNTCTHSCEMNPCGGEKHSTTHVAKRSSGSSSQQHFSTRENKTPKYCKRRLYVLLQQRWFHKSSLTIKDHSLNTYTVMFIHVHTSGALGCTITQVWAQACCHDDRACLEQCLGLRVLLSGYTFHSANVCSMQKTVPCSDLNQINQCEAKGRRNEAETVTKSARKLYFANTWTTL